MRHEDRHTMKWLSDQAVDRLRVAADTPDLSGTGYVLLDKLGAGGMGGVFRVEDTALGRQVALKVIGIVDSSGELSARLLREAKIIAQLEHPGIVPVHDVGTLPDGRAFYTMKLVQGRRLDQRRDELGGVPERLRLFLRVCDAVAFAHARGVLHRDLKPANIMVGSFGEILVMDGGLAKVLHEQRVSADPTVLTTSGKAEPKNNATQSTGITAHGTVMGTPGYMSPEQARGETEQIDLRSDIFSLGAVLRFIIVGGAQEKSSAMPRPLSAICAKATADSPGARYAGVSELSADVSLYMDGLPVTAYSENLFERFGRFYKRHEIAILLITAYLIMRTMIQFF